MKSVLIDSNVLFYGDDSNGEFYKYTKYIFDLQEQGKINLYAGEFTRVDMYKNIITSDDFSDKTPKLFNNNLKIVDMCFLEYNYIKFLELKHNTVDGKKLDYIIFNTDDGLKEFMPGITYREFIRLSFILEDNKYGINIKGTDNAIVLDMIYGAIVYNFDYFISNDKKLIKSLKRIKENNLILGSDGSKIFGDNMKHLIRIAFEKITFMGLIDVYNIEL